MSAKRDTRTFTITLTVDYTGWDPSDIHTPEDAADWVRFMWNHQRDNEAPGDCVKAKGEGGFR